MPETEIAEAEVSDDFEAALMAAEERHGFQDSDDVEDADPLDAEEPGDEEPGDAHEHEAAHENEDTEDSESAADESPEIPAEDAAAYESALKAARQDQLPEAWIESATREEVVKWATLTEKRRQDTREAFQAKAELAREVERLKSQLESIPSKAASGSETGATPQGAPDASNLRDLVAAFAEDAALGEDAADKLAQLLQNSVSPLASQLQEMRSQLEREAESRVTREAQQARTDLEAKYDQVKQPSEWAKVQEQGARLVKAGVSPDFATGIKDAARLRWGDGRKAQGVSQEVARGRDNGKPSTPRKAVSGRKLTPTEKQDALIDKIMREHGE